MLFFRSENKYIEENKNNDKSMDYINKSYIDDNQTKNGYPDSTKM